LIAAYQFNDLFCCFADRLSPLFDTLSKLDSLKAVRRTRQSTVFIYLFIYLTEQQAKNRRRIERREQAAKSKVPGQN
jgi:hypothetical protein